MSLDNLIAEIDAEIAQLQQARTLLSGASSPTTMKRGRAGGVVKTIAAKPAKKKKHKLTPEGRARIAAAAKARWARQKKAEAKAPAEATGKPAKKAPAKKAPAKKVVAKKAPAKKAAEPVESSTQQQ